MSTNSARARSSALIPSLFFGAFGVFVQINNNVSQLQCSQRASKQHKNQRKYPGTHPLLVLICIAACVCVHCIFISTSCAKSIIFTVPAQLINVLFCFFQYALFRIIPVYKCLYNIHLKKTVSTIPLWNCANIFVYEILILAKICISH